MTKIPVKLKDSRKTGYMNTVSNEKSEIRERMRTNDSKKLK